MAYYPFSVEKGAIYTLYNPTNGATAVFNNPASGNYVGMLTDITGLDSPEIRESAEDLAQADGGTHGWFWAGRRPMTMTASIFGHASIRDREIRIDRAKRASLALRNDSVLSWIPSPQAQVGNPSYIEMFTYVRRQGPLRESGGWIKEIQIPLVSEFAAIYSVEQHTQTTAAGSSNGVENKGSWPAYPVFRIAGPSSAMNPTITQSFTNSVINTTGSLLVASGETLEIDTLNHTAYFTSGARNGQSANSFINFATTIWPTMATGSSTFVLSGTTGTLTVVWRDTWM
jgi:hypothetical protein